MPRSASFCRHEARRWYGHDHGGRHHRRSRFDEERQHGTRYREAPAQAGHPWDLGLQAYVGVNADSGRAHTMRGSRGNAPEVSEAGCVLHGRRKPMPLAMRAIERQTREAVDAEKAMIARSGASNQKDANYSTVSCAQRSITASLTPGQKKRDKALSGTRYVLNTALTLRGKFRRQRASYAGLATVLAPNPGTKPPESHLSEPEPLESGEQACPGACCLKGREVSRFGGAGKGMRRFCLFMGKITVSVMWRFFSWGQGPRMARFRHAVRLGTVRHDELLLQAISTHQPRVAAAIVCASGASILASPTSRLTCERSGVAGQGDEPPLRR